MKARDSSLRSFPWPALAAVAAALTASLASASDAKPTAEAGVQTWQIVVAMSYVAMLAGLGLLLVRYLRPGRMRGGPGAATSLVQNRRSTRLSPQLEVTLLEIEGSRILVAATPTAVSMLELRGVPAERPAAP